MKSICDLKSTQKVQERIAELSTHIDSSAATAAIIKNNGYSLDKTPKGKESILYRNLLIYYDGNIDKALSAKSQIYSSNFLENFGDWINNSDLQNVDINGEPDIENLISLQQYHLSNNSDLIEEWNEVSDKIKKEFRENPNISLEEIAKKNLLVSKYHFQFSNNPEKPLVFPKYIFDYNENKKLTIDNIDRIFEFFNYKFHNNFKLYKYTNEEWQNQFFNKDADSRKFVGLNIKATTFIRRNLNSEYPIEIYINTDTASQEDLVEELLHPLLLTLSEDNNELYIKLYNQALKDKRFKKIVKNVRDLYPVGDWDQEITTQALAQLVSEELNENPHHKSLWEVIKEFLNWIETKIKSAYEGDIIELKGNEYVIDDNFNLDSFAQLISAQTSLFYINPRLGNTRQYHLNNDIVITDAFNTAQKAKEINGIDTLRHPDPVTGMHFGNPFTHLERQPDTIKVQTVKDAVVAFEEWLRGTNYQYVQPKRRRWILDQLETGVLVGKPLVYYTTKVPDNSYGQVWYNPETAPNHAHILQKLIQEYAEKLSYTPKNDKELKLRDFLRYASGDDQLFISFISKDKQARHRVKQLLQLWQQRQTELLHFGYSFGNVLKAEDRFDFDSYFKSKDILFNEITEEVARQFIPINNYRVEEAETILPRAYASNFKLGMHNLSEINENFFKKVNPYYKTSVKDTDFLVRLHNDKFNIAFSKNVSGLTKYGTPVKVIFSEDGFRLDADGNKLYKLPNSASVYQDKWGNETVVLQINDQIINEFQTLLATAKDIVSVQPFINNITSLELGKSLISKALNANVIKTFNREIRSILNSSETTKDLIVNLRELYENPNSKYRYQKDLASELYCSFVKSLKFVTARIPTQAFQSFMAMNAVAFTGSAGNDVFVTRWQFWLQGSDMDIDKVYMMGVNLNRFGMMNHWSPLYDYSSLELANLSDQLPVPSKLELIFTDRYNPSKSEIEQIPIEISEINNELIDNILNYYLAVSDKNKKLRMQSIINILDYLNENKSFKVTEAVYNNPLFERLINLLNRHNLYKLDNDSAQNIIARNVRRVSTDSRNMISSYSPIDQAMALFTDKLKEAYKRRDYKDLFDGFSKYEIQESNSDGKQTVGIMANGIKVFFALTQYFNQYYKNNKGNLSKDAFPYFLRKLTINGKERYVSTIADSKLENTGLEFFKNALLQIVPEEVEKGTRIMHTTDDASLVISSLISLATDNAKELALAKMNATIDLASMHIFLAILGFNAEDIVDYTTGQLFKQLAYQLKKNIFLNKKVSINNHLWNSLQTYCTQNKIPKEELTQLRQIYESAQELKAFASLLSINQGVKNDLQKSADYMNKFSNVLSSRLSILSQEDRLNSKPIVIDLIQNKILDSTDSILRLSFIRGIANPSPEWVENTRNKINDLNNRIKELGVKLSDNVDMQKYFADEAYRNLIVELYDLVKMNFNTYDIINHSPNFYNMIKSFSLSIEKFTNLSAKAQLVLKDGYKLYQRNLINNVEYPDGDTDHPVTLYNVDEFYTSKLMRRAQRFVDDYIISDFLQSDFIKNNYRINLVTTGAASKTYDIDFQTNNSLIDFKELMNYIVIPMLKSLYPENTFLNSLVLKDLNKGRGEKDMRWVFKFNVDRLNSNYDILKYNDIVGGFNQLSDLNISLEDILNTEDISINSGNNIKFQDLLYLYNTILNLDNFGQNSLSLLFDKYINDSDNNSLPMQLINHFVKFDNKQKTIEADPHAFMFFLLRRTAGSRQINFRDGYKAFEKNTVLANLDSITINNKEYIDSNIFLNALRNQILTIENITCE